jgi:uncharacterized membrane protein YkvA (DUF1232 family)
MMAELISNFRLVLRLVQDGRVPAWIKVGIPVLVVVYFISPIDVIPDFLIGPGQLDDMAVVLFGMSLMVRFSPGHVVEEHKRALGITDPASGPAPAGGKAGDGTIDGDYRVIPPEG